MWLHDVVLRKTTEARIKACNNVSFCAINYIKKIVVPPELNFNVDFSKCHPALLMEH